MAGGTLTASWANSTASWRKALATLHPQSGPHGHQKAFQHPMQTEDTANLSVCPHRPCLQVLPCGGPGLGLWAEPWALSRWHSQGHLLPVQPSSCPSASPPCPPSWQGSDLTASFVLSLG